MSKSYDDAFDPDFTEEDFQRSLRACRTPEEAARDAETDRLLDGAPADAEKLFWWLHARPGWNVILSDAARRQLQADTGIAGFAVEAAAGHLERAGAAELAIDHASDAVAVRLLDREDRTLARARRRKRGKGKPY